MGGEKRHNPSKRRLDKAMREEGRYCKSSVVTGSCVLISVFLATAFSIRHFWLENKMLLEYQGSMLLLQAHESMVLLGQAILWCCAIPLGVGAVAAFCAEVAQASFRLPSPKLRVDFSRSFSMRNFREGLQRAFPRFGVSTLWSSIFLGILLMYLLSLAMDLLPMLFRVPEHDVPGIVEELSLLPFAIVLLFVLYAGIDYAMEYRRFMKSLAMSDEDLREEHKESEGDPQAKYMRKMLWQEWAIMDMERRIRRSRCVIVEKNSPGSVNASHAQGAGP